MDQPLDLALVEGLRQQPLDLSMLVPYLQDIMKALEEGSSISSRYDGTVVKFLLVSLHRHCVNPELPLEIMDQSLQKSLVQLVESPRTAPLDDYVPLMQAVIEEKDPEEIWLAVLQLVRDTSARKKERAPAVPETPMKSAISNLADRLAAAVKYPPERAKGTPRSSNSSLHNGPEETRAKLREALQNELKECSGEDVEQFFEKYFNDGNIEWKVESQKISQATQRERYNAKQKTWKQWPEDNNEADVWTWLNWFQTKYLKEMPGAYFHTTSKKDMAKASEGGGESQLDFFIKRRNAPSGIGPPMKQGGSTMSLRSSARRQKSRPELWQRKAGHPEDMLLASETHGYEDILVIGEHTKSKDAREKFIQLAGYARYLFSLQPTRYFVHGFILYGKRMKPYVFDRSGCYSMKSFNIHASPDMFIRILCGYCMMNELELGLNPHFKPGNSTNVLKFREFSLRKEPIAKTRAIVGRATACYITVDEKHIVKISWNDVSKARSEALLLEDAHEKKVLGVPRLKDSFSYVKTENLRSTLQVEKRKNIRTDTSDESGHQQTPSPPPVIIKRQFCVQILEPVGRPLSEYEKPVELLRALRDAIETHCSLLLNARILHRDIVMSNILIVESTTTSPRHGMLIDFDLAAHVNEQGNSESTGLTRMSASYKYTAIEILEHGLDGASRDLRHSYRHDLESFFYVLLDCCSNFGRRGSQKDRLERWYIGKYADLHARKKVAMEENGFDKLLDKFSPDFSDCKDLTKEYRRILFGSGAVNTSTPSGPPKTIYDNIIKAFNDAIAKYERKPATALAEHDNDEDHVSESDSDGNDSGEDDEDDEDDGLVMRTRGATRIGTKMEGSKA